MRIWVIIKIVFHIRDRKIDYSRHDFWTAFPLGKEKLKTYFTPCMGLIPDEFQYI